MCVINFALHTTLAQHGGSSHLMPAAGSRVGRSCGESGSPLYNCSGWLGIKHKVTYYREAGYRLTLMAVTAASVSSLTEGYIL